MNIAPEVKNLIGLDSGGPVNSLKSLILPSSEPSKTEEVTLSTSKLTTSDVPTSVTTSGAAMSVQPVLPPCNPPLPILGGPISLDVIEKLFQMYQCLLAWDSHRYNKYLKRQSPVPCDDSDSSGVQTTSC